MIDEIVRAKPAAAKGRYLLSITLANTMGPGIRVDTSRTREAEILERIPEGEAAEGNGQPAPEAEAPEPEPTPEPEPAEESEPAEEPVAEAAESGEPAAVAT